MPINRVPRPSAARVAIVFVFGAVVGSIFDGFHTHGGMTAYPHPFLFGMAWWTLPLFGAAYTALGFSYAALRRATDPVPRPGRLAGGFVLFGALYFATGFLRVGHVEKLALLVAGFGALLLLVDRSRAAWCTGILAALAGPAFEVLLTGTGAFSHLEPDALGIPVWLPGLYLASGPGVAPLAYLLLTAGFPALLGKDRPVFEGPT